MSTTSAICWWYILWRVLLCIASFAWSFSKYTDAPGILLNSPFGAIVLTECFGFKIVALIHIKLYRPFRAVHSLWMLDLWKFPFFMRSFWISTSASSMYSLDMQIFSWYLLLIFYHRPTYLITGKAKMFMAWISFSPWVCPLWFAFFWVDIWILFNSLLLHCGFLLDTKVISISIFLNIYIYCGAQSPRSLI